VVVNLSFRTEEAVLLGVQGHVCELQLTLDSFDQILVMPLVVELHPIAVTAAGSFAHHSNRPFVANHLSVKMSLLM
jgi:hypothetical protein